MHRHFPTLAAALGVGIFLVAGCGAGGSDDDTGVITFASDGGANTLDAAGSEDDTSAPQNHDSSAVDALDAGTADDIGRRQDRGTCPLDKCSIGDACFDNGTANPDNVCQVCLALVGGDDWTSNDASGCDDGLACTSSDKCVDGVCQGAPLGCDDANPCTADSCATGDGVKFVCINTPNTNPCSDGDVCSVGDECDGGTCKAGKLRKCDDGNACTVDTCNKASGCASKAVDGGACDDGELCTTNESCGKGVCAGGKLNTCDDNDACTLDGCAIGVGCKHKDIALLCKDDSVCTNDKCDPKQGCVYAFTTAKCNDANTCTTNDACLGGICTGAKVPTDDKNPCTNDSCDPLSGVAHTPNTLPCSDDDKCTVDDTCKTAKCEAGPYLKCVDGNICTDDGCNPKVGCVYDPNALNCDDGSACTSKDACAKGKCAGAKITCNDANGCTTDSCDPGTADKKGDGCTFTLIISNKCRPTINVSYPKRGATIKQASSSVTVKGTVSSGAGPITSLTVNGKKLTVGKTGAFSYTRKSVVGGNTLSFDAVDKMGTKRHRVQAYLWSKYFFKPDKKKPKSGMVYPGMAFFMNDKTIDDGNHSLPPNDLATIFELYFKSLDIGKLISGAKKKASDPDFSYKFLFWTYNIYIDKVTNGSPKVTLTPVTGALKLTATIPNLKADIHILQGKSKYPGYITSSSVVINATVIPTVKNGKIVSEVKDISVVLNSFVIKVSGGLGGGLLNAILNLFKGTVKNLLVTEFSKAIKSQIGPAMSDALNAMAVSFEFDLPRLDDPKKKINVQVVTDVWATDIKPDGARFDLRTGAYATKVNSIDNLGVPARIGCGGGKQTLHLLRQDKLELGLADDTLNEILYAAWLGGLLEFPLPASMLGNVDVKQYGITNLKMKATAWLAPTITDCNPKAAPKAHIGDFRIDATMDLLGQKMDVVLWATFTAGVKIETKNGKLSVSLTAIEKIDTEVNVLQEKLIGSEAAIDKIISESLIKGLMGTLAGKPLGEFPLPKIDLSKAVPGIPKGTGIEIDPKKVTRKQGNSIVGGQLK